MPLAYGIMTMGLLLPIPMRILRTVTLLALAKSVLPMLQYIATAKVELKLLRIAAQNIVRCILLLLLAHALCIQINGHAEITDLAHAIVIEQHIARRQIAMDNLRKEEKSLVGILKWNTKLS